MSKNLSPVIIKTFHELDKEELYKFMQLRIEVFIVEQDCPYQDLDDLDSQGTHIWIEEDGVVLTYLRLNPPGTRFKEPSLGRIVTKEAARSRGLAEIIINKAERKIEEAENQGANKNDTIQDQIDREQKRIDTAYTRIQPLVAEQQKATPS